MATKREGQRQVGMWVPEDLYDEYKAILYSRVPRTTPTYDYIAHIKKVVDEERESRRAKSSPEKGDSDE